MPTPRNKALIYPGLADPRWLQFVFLLSFDLFALLSPDFNRALPCWLAGVAACVVTDFALAYLTKGIILVPLSGLITSLGLLLLCDSPYAWMYALMGLLSIVSKHLIRPGGRHIFNPLNFGLVACLLYFSQDVTVQAGRWGGSLPLLLAVVALGILVVYRAQRLGLCLAYIGTFFLGALARAHASGLGLGVVCAPMTGAAFHLYTFFMISDPMTTPETSGGRLTYGAALGLCDTLLRAAHIRNAPFYALFALSGFLPAFRRLFEPRVPEVIWRPKEIPLP